MKKGKDLLRRMGRCCHGGVWDPGHSFHSDYSTGRQRIPIPEALSASRGLTQALSGEPAPRYTVPAVFVGRHRESTSVQAACVQGPSWCKVGQKGESSSSKEHLILCPYAPVPKPQEFSVWTGWSARNIHQGRMKQCTQPLVASFIVLEVQDLRDMGLHFGFWL